MNTNGNTENNAVQVWVHYATHNLCVEMGLQPQSKLPNAATGKLKPLTLRVIPAKVIFTVLFTTKGDNGVLTEALADNPLLHLRPSLIFLVIIPYSPGNNIQKASEPLQEEVSENSSRFSGGTCQYICTSLWTWRLPCQEWRNERYNTNYLWRPEHWLYEYSHHGYCSTWFNKTNKLRSG